MVKTGSKPVLNLFLTHSKPVSNLFKLVLFFTNRSCFFKVLAQNMFFHWFWLLCKMWSPLFSYSVNLVPKNVWSSPQKNKNIPSLNGPNFQNCQVVKSWHSSHCQKTGSFCKLILTLFSVILLGWSEYGTFLFC